jgi:hypothetical protein
MKTYLALLFLVAIGITACKKDEKECVAGDGGSVNLVASPEHNSVPIISKSSYPDSAFLKFNTQDFPGDDPALYDLVAVGDAMENHVHLNGLKCGKYYIYMTAFDSSALKRVTGGTSFEIEEETGEVRVTVPVAATE